MIQVDDETTMTPAPDGQAQAAPAAASVTATIAPLLWSLEEAALALGTSARTLKRAVAEGALPPGALVRPFGRRRLFSRLVLEEWVRRGCPMVRSAKPRPGARVPGGQGGGNGRRQGYTERRPG